MSVESHGIVVAFFGARHAAATKRRTIHDSQIKKYLKLSAIYFAVAYVGIFVAYQVKAPLFGLAIFALAFIVYRRRGMKTSRVLELILLRPG